MTNNIVEGNLETKLATYEQMQHDAATVVRRIREGKSQKRKSQKKEDQCALKVKGSAQNTMFFECFCGSGWWKNSLAKAAGEASEHFWKLSC